MSQDGSEKEEQVFEVLFEQTEEVSSQEPPQEEWSSLLCFLQGPDKNIKRQLYEEGLYEPPSEEICAKYIPLSDSSILRHPLYPYPAIQDPGIEDAVLLSPGRKIYTDDGQDLYLEICEEMDIPPCKRFHKELIEDEINISYYGISPLGFRPMAMVLKRNRIVKRLNLSSNFISMDGCWHLGDMLEENFTLVELNLEQCRMTAPGMLRLAHKMHRNKTIRKLNLAKNQLCDAGLEHLANAIYKGASVVELDLSYNSLTSKSATFLADALEIKNNLTHLDLSWNSLSVPRPVEILIAQFLDSKHLIEINLAWNSLSTRFAKGLTNLLLIPNIQIIKLNNNNLCGEAIPIIAANIPKAKKLKVLDMSSNPMSPLEAFQLLRYMGMRRVKCQNLLLDDVYVNKNFVELRGRILGLKFRTGAVITHGDVLPQILVPLRDMRDLMLTRAQFVCSKPKKLALDVGVMILELNKMHKGQPIEFKSFLRAVKSLGAVQMNDELIFELASAFKGPKVGKENLVNIAAMADYVHRKWPDKKLPPTPPPTPPPPPPPPKGKGPDKGKGADKGKGPDIGKGKKK